MVKVVDNNIEQKIHDAIEYAHDACSTVGAYSSECAVAWDIVEELQAALADRRGQEQTSLERYCTDHPSASECLIYDV